MEQHHHHDGSPARLLVPAIVVALGVAAAGWLIGSGFTAGRAGDRYVSVKGVAEREVDADIAFWPLRFVAADDDLGAVQQRLTRDTGLVMEFLERAGVPAEQVSVQGLEVTDQNANPYRSGEVGSRFIVAKTLMVRSDDPPRIRAASQRVGELVDAGVVLSSQGGPSQGPTYLFTRLNDHKPAMIAEATAAAREAATQFAADSGSRLGGIRTANQGVFVVLARDRTPGVSEENQLEKTLRVVSTVEYLLE
ncbi:MAG: SIMPL domain-containing protein [Thermoanaerobaculales bacterium]|jgi:hypothetical protein|nr:SIMPL domain-containing protein [Thermoanaerobaculales bacterium]